MRFGLSLKKRLGFSLTELAIVIGVAGILLGAIWAASAGIYANNKANQAAGQILQIVSNYRKLYAMQGADNPGPSWIDITCTGVNAGYFPSDMIKTTPCVPSTGTIGTASSSYPQTPWGSGTYVVVMLTEPPYQDIIVSYINLTQAACVALSTAIANNNANLVYENINGNNQLVNGTYVNGFTGANTGTAYTNTQINSFCAQTANQPSGNYVNVGYLVK